MKNKILKSDGLYIFILLLLIIFGLSVIPYNQTVFNPISSALSDFDINDIIFSKLRDEQSIDTNIVLVNIGNLRRKEIAAQIERINQYNPKVLGIDAVFFGRKNRYEDSTLAASLSKVKNLVLVNKLEKFNDKKNCYEYESGSENCFVKKANIGFSNFSYESKSSFRTIRIFKPFAVCKNGLRNSFAAKIIELYDPASYEKLRKRNNTIENINYRGNIDKFYFLDSYDLLDPGIDYSFINNKIVLLGFTGIDRYTKTLDDIFFTPLNNTYAGRTFPDMYGMVIHANIISMILAGNYINIIPSWINILISLILIILNIAGILFFRKKYTHWAGTLAGILILSETIIVIFISLLLLNYLNIKFNTTLILISVVLIPSIIDIYETYIQKFKNKIFDSREKTE